MADKNHQTSFSVTGMTCTSCSGNVERRLKKMDGVLFASVNLATEKCVVIAQREIHFDRFAEEINAIGYKAVRESATPDIMSRRFQQSWRLLKRALWLTVPLTLLMFWQMVISPIPLYHWLELSLAGLVLSSCGRTTIKGAWIAFRHAHSNMDTLISLGMATALLTNVLHLAGIAVPSYGAIAAMLLTLHLSGRYIESRLRDRAAKSIRELTRLQSDQATLIREGTTLRIPVAALKRGDQVLVKGGDKVPADAVVNRGSGRVDESMISGESLPVKKQAGDPVVSGTLLLSGMLEVTVDQVGDDTFLSRMIRLVEEAQSSKIPIQALVDRLTLSFIPAVLILALLGAAGWMLFNRQLTELLNPLANILPWVNHSSGPLSNAVIAFVSTIVIACPCALGLATPLALMVASGVAARRGVVIRNGEVIQSSKDINAILIDKTGTLTAGQPQVVESNLDLDLWPIVAAMEEVSSHPLARPIIKYAREQGIYRQLELKEVIEKAGEGLEAEFKANTYQVGRPLDPSIYSKQLKLGQIVVEVRRNSHSIGFIALVDPIREFSESVVSELKQRGIRPILLTGDNRETAETVARQVGISDVRAGVKPAEKVAVVRELQLEGCRVAMVGDGINDAAALKAADIGIAVGTGTDLAIESGDLVIVKGDLRRIIDTITLSTFTFRIIKQNLVWAFVYNLLAIPLALLGLLQPLLAEAAMTLSSINVTLNSIRIGKK